MSGNHSLSKVSCMYIHICTHIYKAPLCLFLYDTSVYLSGMQPIKKESEPQIIGDSKKQLKLETWKQMKSREKLKATGVLGKQFKKGMQQIKE